MPPLGKFLLRAAVRAMIHGLKRVPVLGAAVELWEEGRNVAAAMQAEQEKLSIEARIEQLEALAALPPPEARQIAKDMIAEIKIKGESVAPDLAAAIEDLAAAMPVRVQEVSLAILTRARKSAFYAELIPARRPRYQPGDKVPHKPGWSPSLTRPHADTKDPLVAPRAIAYNASHAKRYCRG